MANVSVTLVVPACADRLTMIRQVIGDVLADPDLDADTRTDMLLAVDAVCTLVITYAAASSTVTCAAVRRSGQIDIRIGGRLDRDSILPHAGFAWEAVESSVDKVFVVSSPGGEVEVSLCRIGRGRNGSEGSEDG